jgi:hypothetical protein
MSLSHNPVTVLRIYRHADNSIVYVATTGKDTVVYTSGTPCPFPVSVPMFVYGQLYASGDRVTSASFETGEVQYGSV